MMMEELAARLAANPDIASKVIIAPLGFQIQINNAKVKTYTKNNSPLLHRYHNRIKEGVEKIYFPININGDHWIAGVVDVQAQSVGYGMKQLNEVYNLHSRTNTQEIRLHHHMDPLANSCVTFNGGSMMGLESNAQIMETA